MARRDKDNYSTDFGLARWAVKRAADLAVLSDERTIIEPCCGDGAPFATAGKEIGLVPYGFDVREVYPSLWAGDDVDGGWCLPECDIGLFETGGETWDIVATNPPYNIGEDVVRSSLKLLKPYGCAAFLVKMAFLSTQKRSRLFVQRPPAEVWVLCARPSFTGDGKSDVAQEYAFIFWRGDEMDSLAKTLGPHQTRLYWLDNSKMMGKRRVRVEKGVSNE